MKKTITIILATCILLVSSTVYSLPTLKITIRVIDESGKPVENARVGADLERPKIKGVGVDTTAVIGITDSNGLFTVKGSGGSYLGFNATKEGYYMTVDHFRNFTGVSGIIGFRRWKPWNPTIDVVLKKIINPIPMYVAKIQGKSSADDLPAILPEEGKLFGYDLIAKDWVVPNGQGLHSDFIFKIDVDYYNSEPLEYDAMMTLKFTNPDDGIQSFYAFRKKSSELRSAHRAPITGYQDKLVTRKVRVKKEVLHSPYRDDQNYYFRVRTKRDEQGNIIEAHYGKIYGNIRFSIPRKGDRKGKIYFSYYLNPNNNDTNVENAPEQNLFPKPKDHRGAYRFKP